MVLRRGRQERPAGGGVPPRQTADLESHGGRYGTQRLKVGCWETGGGAVSTLHFQPQRRAQYRSMLLLDITLAGYHRG